MAVAADTLERLAYAALAEDVGEGDVTTESVVDVDALGTAELVLKEPGVVCGLALVEAVFRALDPDVEVESLVGEGALVESGTAVVRVTGPLRAILTGERTALNFLARLSGIATLTRRYVEAVEGTGVAILDTRKTTPGLRALEKHAVVVGGGRNHRFGLDDGVLIKDNHLRVAGSIQDSEALDAGVETILLDNMTPDGLLAAVVLVKRRARLEASGGVTLENVRAIAETGVDEISVGALTHSAGSLDVSLELT
jgi:nicotinate-nucleotide pyrophosphorylase (carboxylating)